MNKIGEIVESNSTEFTAECYELHALPALGSLVKVMALPVSNRADTRWRAEKMKRPKRPFINPVRS